MVGCLAVLADKDADGIAGALSQVLDRAICTELDRAALAARALPGARSRPAGELAAACAAAGVPAEEEPLFETAMRRARELGSRHGLPVLIVGSHYLLAPARDALAGRGLCDD
jgi:folylpolyglutamate synthase/dihydropteroate synthase